MQHIIVLGIIAVVALCLWTALGSRDATAGTDDETDRAAIEAHVRGLFEAYLGQDREAIRTGHTSDWRGFPIPVGHIVRGIDEYTVFADRGLQEFTGTRYEIDEFEVDLHGDVGIVYYTATWHFRDQDGGERVLPLRSVDVYRRDSDGWNQCGSNICRIPEGAARVTR